MPHEPHWTIARVFELIKEAKVTPQSVTAKAGLGHYTVNRWDRPHCSPGVMNLEAALNALGYELQIVKMAPERHKQATKWYVEHDGNNGGGG